MTVLNSYWPDEKMVDQCIMTEAESLPDSLLLAVHEPMQLSRREYPNDHKHLVEGTSGEQVLFDFFLQHNRPIPLIGSSGVGKSHLIRWVSAQLQRHPEKDRYHVIQIPKNASLPRVLSLILNGLEGEAYDRIRKNIEGVGQSLQTEKVAEHLAHKLRQALQDEFEQAETDYQKVQSGYEISETEELRIEEILEHTGPKDQGLQALFFDNHLTKHFTGPGACLHNIAKRLCQGASQQDLDVNSYQLTGADFTIDTDININIKQASNPVKKYVVDQQLLGKGNLGKQKRNDVARIANQVLYRACEETVAELLHFNRTSLQDMMRDIRQQLLKQGKTLVILVEDLATTSALQGAFIECLLEEEEYQGEQRLCELKAMIAVTEGYAGYQHLTVRDSIWSRAQYEWIIEADLRDEENTLNRIVDFCGRYLNAARYGREDLSQYYQQHKNDQQHYQLPIWQDSEIVESEALSTLDAFGVSSQSYPLFPFNRSAIMQLARKHCLKNDHLVYNPRSILHCILRTPLKNYRSAYEDGQFPVAEMERIRCNFTLSQAVRAAPITDKPRVEALFALWGNNVERLDIIAEHIAPQVFAEFNLTDAANTLLVGKESPINRPVEPSVKSPVKPQQPVQSENEPLAQEFMEPTELKKWRKLLDAWSQGNEFPNDRVVKLRQWIINGLNNFIDWDQQLCRPVPFVSSDKGRIHLPVKVGNTGNNDNALIIVATREKYRKNPGKFNNAFMAMAAYEHHGSWQYDGGEMDFAYYHNFFAKFAPQVSQKIVTNERNKLNSIVQKLHQGAGFLGVEGVEAPKPWVKLNALLSSTVTKPPHALLDQDLSSDWEAIVAEQQELRQELLRLTAAQKTRSEPYAVDGKLIANSLNSNAVHKVTQPARIDKVIQRLPQYRRTLQPLQEKLKALFDGDIKAVLSFSEKTREVLQLAQKADVARPMDIIKSMNAALAAWDQEERVAETKKIRDLRLPENKPVRLLQEIVSVDGAQISIIKEMLTLFANFDTETSKFLEQRINMMGGGEVDIAKQQVEKNLEDIEDQLVQLEGDIK